MPTKRLSRRTVLRGALATGGTVAIPLPILDIMLNNSGTAFAQTAAALPRRYITWFFGNGILPGKWNPTSTGADWALSEQLMPLASVKNSLTVVTGLKNMIGNASPHPMGSAAATTGAPVQSNSASSISIDQAVANVNKGGKFPSLEVGCSDATPNGPENTLHSVSHKGLNAPLPPEFDPHAAFTRIFMGATGTTTGPTASDQLAKWNQTKRSILDTVIAEGNEVKAMLGAGDKARLEAHLEAIRQLEMRLQTTPTTPTTPTTIMIPTDPKTSGINKDTRAEAPKAVNDIMAEMLAVALASDITRNATFTFTLPAAHAFYRHLASDMNADFHDVICHGDAGDSSNQPRVHKGVLYAMQCLAVFVNKLEALKEGTGSVLDNSLVYVTSCTGWGKVHDVNEWPALLIGKAGGAVKGNQHLRFPGQNLSNILLTIANTFGAKLTTFGKGSGMTDKELAGIRVA